MLKNSVFTHLISMYGDKNRLQFRTDYSFIG